MRIQLHHLYCKLHQVWSIMRALELLPSWAVEGSNSDVGKIDQAWSNRRLLVNILLIMLQFLEWDNVQHVILITPSQCFRASFGEYANRRAMRSNSDILCEFQSKLNHNTYSTDQTAHHPKPLDERMFINIIYNEEGWGNLLSVRLFHQQFL